MFDKTIVDMWEDKDNHNTYLLSFDDYGTLFITERIKVND
jgi:hypothetical protein